LTTEKEEEAAGPFYDMNSSNAEIGTVTLLTSTAKSSWHNLSVVTFNGSRDTHIHNGRDYKTRTLRSIFDDDTPAGVDKDDAPAFIPSSYHQSDARAHEVQRERGSYVCNTGDIDKANHSMEVVADLVQVYAGEGTAFKIHSSSGATSENQKWRIKIPLAGPVSFQTWQDMQWGLVKWMAANDVELDPTLTRAGQHVFLPNVPPAKRGEDGEPLFYQTHKVDGRGFDPGRSEVAAQWIAAAVAEREEAAAETARIHAAAKIKTATRAASGKGSPIEQFNDEHDVEGLLGEYGYTPGPSTHWRSPLQTTNSYGTRVKDQHWVSVSGSDRAAGLGSETKDGHSHGDAFDLFAFFAHKGDRTVALKAWSHRRGAKSSPAPDTPANADNDQENADDQAPAPHLSEIALAEQFARDAAELFRWTPGLDWMHNQGSHWARDDKMQRYTLAKSICKDAAGTVDRAQLKVKTASASTTHAVLNLARSESGIVTDITEWDAQTMILNTPGGAYDLETGERTTRENLLFTKVAGVAPTKTKTPMWEKFLCEVFGNDLALVEFIQRMAGYSLTGVVREQKLFYLYGSGANGKSVFLEVLRNVAGAYAHNLPSEALMTSKHERHPTTFAALHGKRVAISSEIEDGAHWAESKIKSLTGDATMTARFMKQDEFEFPITHKHILAGNFKPRLKGDDPAIVRRMVLVPFNQTFSGARKDDRLSEKLREEYPGILQWCIEGASKWARSGLKIPEAVTSSSSEYMAEQNDIAIWLDDVCEIGADFQDSVKNLYASYAVWKEEQGEKPQSAKAWGERLLKANPMFKRLTRVAGARDRGFACLRVSSSAQAAASNWATKGL
jgi:putative DNA primase/helicase